MEYFFGFLPAKMSCKLWLNVWTCRSFTCPFTLRNLDRNPTAALISGFIVPRAQRVCIEKGNGDDPCAFAVFSLRVCPTVRLSLHFWAAIRICQGCCCFSWHLLVEVEGSFFWVLVLGPYSVGKQTSVVGKYRGLEGPLLPRSPTLPVRFLPPEWSSRSGGAGFYSAPSNPHGRHKPLQQQQLSNPRPCSVWRATYRRRAAFTSWLWK